MSEMLRSFALRVCHYLGYYQERIDKLEKELEFERLQFQEYSTAVQRSLGSGSFTIWTCSECGYWGIHRETYHGGGEHETVYKFEEEDVKMMQCADGCYAICEKCFTEKYSRDIYDANYITCSGDTGEPEIVYR